MWSYILRLRVGVADNSRGLCAYFNTEINIQEDSQLSARNSPPTPSALVNTYHNSAMYFAHPQHASPKAERVTCRRHLARARGALAADARCDKNRRAQPT